MSKIIQCPKCLMFSGDDWTQCRGGCPMKMSPHYDAQVEGNYQQLQMDERPFAPVEII